jgi:uncharacterized membrane protein YidH (DUF202 family)
MAPVTFFFAACLNMVNKADGFFLIIFGWFIIASGLTMMALATLRITRAREIERRSVRATLLNFFVPYLILYLTCIPYALPHWQELFGGR